MLDQMVWEGMGAPGKQYEDDNVMLGRSAWAGSQRYGGAVWSGDTSSNFENLNQQFRAGLNFVMSGIPYWCVLTIVHPSSVDFHQLYSVRDGACGGISCVSLPMTTSPTSQRVVDTHCLLLRVSTHERRSHITLDGGSLLAVPFLHMKTQDHRHWRLWRRGH
jgi:hypothetical protein